jgi:hypothetical protein
VDDYLTRKGQGQLGSGHCREVLGLCCDGGQVRDPCIGAS